MFSFNETLTADILAKWVENMCLPRFLRALLVRETNKVMEDNEQLFWCSFCSYRCLIWRDLNRHYFVAHSNEPLFLQKCVVTGCSQTFRSYSSFNSHLNRKHRGIDVESEARKSLLSSSSGTSTSENAERTDGTVDSGGVAEMDIDAGSFESSEISPENEHEFEQEDDEVRGCQLYPSNDDRERSAALLLLTAKERYKLTQSAIDFITQQVQSIISYGVDDIQEVVQEWLENQGIAANFAELSARLEPLRNPFASIGTEYMQSKFYRDHFNLVVRSIHWSQIPTLV